MIRTISMRIRTYSELIRLQTFEERLEYLRLAGQVGRSTFAFDRYLNQRFYTSKEWKNLRPKIIVRDGACDLGVQGFDILDRIYIHHMNPMLIEDLTEFNPDVLNPDFLICTSFETHNAIHYGKRNRIPSPLVERMPNDTCPWKQ